MRIRDIKQEPLFWAVLSVALGLFFVLIVAPPAAFPTDKLVVVSQGTLDDVAIELADQGVIKSMPIFKVGATFLGADERLQAGEYLFDAPTSALRVAWRIAQGEYGIDPISIRVPEGYTRVQMADLFEEFLVNFDGKRFLGLTHDKEGFLFPDTYVLLPTADAVTVTRVLEDTFKKRIKSLEEEIMDSGYSLNEIITMASIIEREVSDPIDRRLVSGVLWNRIAIDMPLQVDASFLYILGKGSSELTLEDLETDSPYNTYTNRGLPPGPIGSPGFDAIVATLEPTPSDYFFYLSDDDGVTHYAETFEEHKTNKNLYLR